MAIHGRKLPQLVRLPIAIGEYGLNLPDAGQIYYYCKRFIRLFCSALRSPPKDQVVQQAQKKLDLPVLSQDSFAPLKEVILKTFRRFY